MHSAVVKRDFIYLTAKKVLYQKCGDRALTAGFVLFTPDVTKTLCAGFSRPTFQKDVVKFVYVGDTFVEVVFHFKVVLRTVVEILFFHSFHLWFGRILGGFEGQIKTDNRLV